MRNTDTHWSFERPSNGARVLGHVLLTFRIHREDDWYVGECQELGISSFGDDLDAAVDATLEATAAYLDTLEELGERDQVFKRVGLNLSPSPVPDEIDLKITAHPGEFVSPQRVSVLTGVG